MSERRFPNDRCREVLEFYFGETAWADCSLAALEARTKMWFFRDPALDAEIRERFGADVERAAAGELAPWGTTALGALGLVVLLDQLPRNIYRDSPRAFARDAEALAITLDGIERRFDEELTGGERLVFYLPTMHTEDAAMQRRCIGLYEKLVETAPEALRSELAKALKAAQRHAEIVERFGRFPHRNKVLGRESTAEEVEFLSGPNSSF